MQQAVFGSGVETQPNDKGKEKHIISDEFVNEPESIKLVRPITDPMKTPIGLQLVLCSEQVEPKLDPS